MGIGRWSVGVTWQGLAKGAGVFVDIRLLCLFHGTCVRNNSSSFRFRCGNCGFSYRRYFRSYRLWLDGIPFMAHWFTIKRGRLNLH